VRVYVAGASRELDRVDAFIAAMLARGHELALDWREPIRERTAAGGTDTDLADDAARVFAVEDLTAICGADLFILLAPAEGGSGCWVELGFAISRGIPIVVSGPAARRSVFTRLAGIADRDEDALAMLDQVEVHVDETAAWRCVTCGCSNEAPCEGGCAWVAERLCSRCATKTPPASWLLGVR
jgi:nucleoside 2-deoxyribosyltransferase